MAGLLDLLSGRSSDIYGNGLLTPEQRGGLGNIGLLALAGKLGQLAGPSFSPVPDFGAALGQAAGAYGASQEGAGTAALNAILTGQKGRKLEQELDYYKQLGPVLQKLGGQWPGADGGAGGGTAATPETGSTGSTGGGAAAPLGAGGGGGSDAPAIPQSEAVDKARYYARLYGVPEEMFLHQINGENGFKASGTSSAGAQGIAQFMPGTAKQYGVNVANVDSSLDGAARYMRDLYKQTGSWEGALRSYLGAKSDATLAPILASNKPYAAAFAAARGGGAPGAAPTAAAPVGAGGLLAPTAPNPLSDADPIVGIPRPAARPQTAAAPGGEAALVQRYYDETAGTPNPPSYAEWKARLGGSIIDRTQGFGPMLGRPIAPSGGGGPLAAPPGAGGDPIMSVTSADQAGGGDAPAAAAPRAPLPTMGPTGVELPPMQGPLAAPAPAAAAPAAPGPGLLSPPGAPAAALPRVNPAYDALLRNLGLAGALAEGAGLKNVLGPIQQALEASPAYKGQVKTAEEAASDPFIRGRAEQKAALDRVNQLAQQGGIIGANGQVVPWQGFQDLLRLNEQAKAEGTEPSQQRQKILEFHLDNLKNGKVVDPNTGQTLPARGAIELEQQKAAAIAAAQAAADLAKQREQVGSIDPIKARNEVLAGEYKETVSAADAASKAKVPLTQIENAMPDFRTGQTAQTRLTLAKTWQDFASNIGLPPNSDLARMIASGEIINKSGTTLGFELARTLGSREAQNIVQQAVAANPGLAVSPGGNKELIGLIKQGLQRDIDKREFFDNHFRQYGSYDRAATEFNRINPVEKYVSQILPYSVATPADAAKLPPGTRFKSPNDPSGLVRTVPER
jgi:hypothetical protein